MQERERKLGLGLQRNRGRIPRIGRIQSTSAFVSPYLLIFSIFPSLSFRRIRNTRSSRFLFSEKIQWGFNLFRSLKWTRRTICTKRCSPSEVVVSSSRVSDHLSRLVTTDLFGGNESEPLINWSPKIGGGCPGGIR